MSENSFIKNGAGAPRLLKNLIASSILSTQLAHATTISSHEVQPFNHRSLYALATEKGMTITQNPILSGEYLALVSGPSLLNESSHMVTGRATLESELTAVDKALVPSTEPKLELPTILSNEPHTPSVIWVGDSTDLPLLDGDFRFLNPIFSSFHQMAHASVSKAGEHSITQFEKESVQAAIIWREIHADTFAVLATIRSAELSVYDSIKLIDNLIENRNEMMFMSLAPTKYSNFTALGLEVVKDWIQTNQIKPQVLDLSTLATLTENMTNALLQVDLQISARRNHIEKDPREVASRLHALANHVAKRNPESLDLNAFQNWLGDSEMYPGARKEMFKIVDANFIKSMNDDERARYYHDLGEELSKTQGMKGYTGKFTLYSHHILDRIEQHIERDTTEYRLMKAAAIDAIKTQINVDWLRNTASEGTYNLQRNRIETHHDPMLR